MSVCITAASLIFQWTKYFTNRSNASLPHAGHGKRVLITGVGMTKGLFLARAMYIGGCTVIAADFDHHGNFQCGRFSRAVHKFYALKSPSQQGVDAYMTQVVDIIRREQIDLWISCSGVATAIEDAQLAETIEQLTSCKAFQLDEQVVSILDDKMKFMKKTSELGLTNLRWHPLETLDDVDNLVQSLQSSKDSQFTEYIIKSASMDDATRGALPILRSTDTNAMQKVLSHLDFSSGRTWILQEYIDSGEEYCTQAVVVHGNVNAFTACKSESILMHYTQLDPQSILFQQMLQFTREYVSGLSKETKPLTGHMSFDFLIRYQTTEGGFTGILAPIECNPRCHTATVLFRGHEEELSACYLSTLQPRDKFTPLLGNPTKNPGFYWVAHDIVTLFIVPLLELLQNPSHRQILDSIRLRAEGILHVLSWTDPTYEWWDPLPWFVLNHVYWPIELLLAAWSGTRWKQLNVSTTKMFKI